jgi:hypothetical protein
MNHSHVKLQSVTKEYVIHVIGEVKHDFLFQTALSMKKATQCVFVDSFGNHKALRFVPMHENISYFIDDEIPTQS